MIYTPQTKKAMRLMYEAHKDAWDKSGVPYVFHPFHVAEQMDDEISTIVALLHDVVEDTDYTLDDLRKMGFSEEVCEALDLLTHRKEEPYPDYVRSIRNNPIAAKVKLADLAHNSDRSRFDSMTEADFRREEKYKAAMKILRGEED
ncbi:MAG: bifunctional (p)ppGpp synthetase/guanosine-3',5'-bis(diphosphate) 3'-pyrophosphohydrolase [Clostridia bacterium]|nr:bifunctional (p)ppGpp synthetase/guanosine-3',5'-bis(diphosphate) 3'-pyrophosphohydrolase [Clostridia bacterium]